MKSRLKFAEDKFGELPGQTPYIDGTSLIHLVTEFEVAQGYDGSHNYSGTAPWDEPSFKVEEAGSLRDRGEALVLSCKCGVSGCWPLYASVSVEKDLITWHSFNHGTRPSRYYSGFGPFRFSRLQYNEAVKAAGRHRHVTTGDDQFGSNIIAPGWLIGPRS